MKRTLNKKMSQDDMRLLNNLLVLKILREEGETSMPQLSKKTLLTLPAISAIISDLEEAKLVKKSGTMQAKRGRFPALYDFNGDAYHIISLAIRSDSISVGLVNLEGKVLEVLTACITERKSPEHIALKAAALIEKMILNSMLSNSDILGLGISMHGIVDPTHGVSVYPAQLNWRDYPLIDRLREKFNFPMKMDNDMNCLLLAEKWFGRAKEIESFVIVNVDYGVGMGIMTHNSVLRGENFGAGQIGHIPIADNNIQCECGRIGCLETVASEKAILKDAINKIHIENIDLDKVYEKANGGDALAVELIENAGLYLGKGLSILINILNPKMIIITGGILRVKDIFFTAFQKAINNYALPTNVKNLQVYSSEIKEHNDIIGAATLWIEELFTGKILFGQKEHSGEGNL